MAGRTDADESDRSAVKRAMLPLTVRPMRPEDLDAVVAIAAVVPTAPHWPPSEFTRMLQRIAQDPQRRGAWVALVDGNANYTPGVLRSSAEPTCINAAAALPALALFPGELPVVQGFAMASQVAGVAELEALVTAPGYRGRGIGACVLQSVIHWSRSVQATRLQLEVRVSNDSAIRLYRRQGFVEDGVRRGYYRNPDEDAVLFSLALEEQPPPLLA